MLFWIIVLDVWSMESQLTTCTSSSVPVFALYFSANCFQKAAVWSLEYSAATSLIFVAFFVEPPRRPRRSPRRSPAAGGECQPGGQRDRGHPNRVRVS